MSIKGRHILIIYFDYLRLDETSLPSGSGSGCRPWDTVQTVGEPRRIFQSR